MNFRIGVPVFLSMIMLFTACDEDDGPDYNVPLFYTFENVDYSGQTTRLDMVEALTVYMKTGNTSGTKLNAQRMKDMYANENDPWDGDYAYLNQATKDIKSKVFLADQNTFDTYIDSLAASSLSTTAGSNGTAGVLTSNDGTKNYLVSANGIEYTQLIEKGLMGALMYYQGVAVYLGDGKMDVDNTIVEPGEGTEMEHHWDEAFGYFGVPTDFPGNTADARFWGRYTNGRESVLGLNQVLMDGFLTGRAAISNDDLTTRDDMRVLIKAEWDKVVAGTALHYLNGGIANFADDALRCHELSEAIAFTMSLKYNPGKRISDAQIDQVLDLIGTNLYDVTVTDLNAAIDIIAGVYEWESIKGNF